MSISPQLGGGHRVEIPAGAISYRACGNGSPIVFVHGVGFNGDLWRRLAGIGNAEHPDHRVSMELPGIEPVAEIALSCGNAGFDDAKAREST